MRLRIVIPVLGLGLLLAVAALLVRPGRGGTALNRPPADGAAPPTVAAADPGAAPKPGPVPAPPSVARPAAAPNVTCTESPQAREQNYVQERIEQLMELAMDDQPASLETILSELNNREPEIRQAAVQAAMQFGSRQAIPRLREAADQTDDLREKAAIQDAIEFLQVPTAAETAAARAAKR